MTGTVIPIRPPESLNVHRPGELPEVVETRLVALSAQQVASLEILAERLAELGVVENATMLRSIVVAWGMAG